MVELLTEESSFKIEDNPIYKTPYTRFILANIQLITNGLEIANGSMKIFHDSLLKFLKFNITVMKIFWSLRPSFAGIVEVNSEFE